MTARSLAHSAAAGLLMAVTLGVFALAAVEGNHPVLTPRVMIDRAATLHAPESPPAAAEEEAVPTAVATVAPPPGPQPYVVTSQPPPPTARPAVASVARISSWCASYCGEPAMILGCPPATTAQDLTTLACLPSGVVGYVVWHRPGTPYDNPPPPPPSSCPVAGWVHVAYVLVRPMPTYASTTASASRLGIIPTGTMINACRRPDGWMAVTGFGWARAVDQ